MFAFAHMTMQDRQRRPESAEPRPRLEIPGWMAVWPRGVQPIGARASRRGVELLYRAPAEQGFAWFRVVASLAPGRPSGVEVRAIPGAAPEVVERLARAVEHHLSRSAAARGWLTRARTAVESLARLRVFGGDEHDAVDELLACIAALGDTEAQEGEAALLDRIDHALARAERQLGAAVAELGIALWLASGAVERALAAWARHAEAIEARNDDHALMCTAIMRGYLGDIAGAQARAIELAARTRDAIGARHAGELLEWLGRPQLAVEQLQIAASDVGGDEGAFDAYRRLAGVAIAARQREPLHCGAAAMVVHARGPEQRLEAAMMQREAGEFLAAEHTLELLLREHPEHLAAQRALASSRLWRGEHRSAASLARALLARVPNDPVALRILGVAEFLAGDVEPGLSHLTTALALDERDDEARLWRGRLLDRLGRYGEARTEVAKVTLGDHVAWQLLRALIEEHALPDYRIELDTWFIVDQNIRQLLGDAAPVDSKVSHEVAVAAIEQALARLGGNHSTRLTTPTSDGSLRWLDQVESPRHRSELLQFQASYRPFDEVIAEFETLAAAHPEVPFFTTYPAELLLWRGEYEHALARFEQAWYATRTRWAYVGAGAASALLGRDDRALQLWEEGKGYYTYIDAEATYCYRGEVWLRRGELELARADLELAVRARPARLGAWIGLALLHHAEGGEGPMREAAARVEQLCPAFVWLVRRELGHEQGLLDVEGLARVLERLRERMRGNRSSVMYTMIDAAGLLRVIPVAPTQVWRDHARRSLVLFEGELLSQLAARAVSG
jgi:tetratricopeptide (TPR) repeat protein